MKLTKQTLLTALTMFKVFVGTCFFIASLYYNSVGLFSITAIFVFDFLLTEIQELQEELQSIKGKTNEQ